MLEVLAFAADAASRLGATPKRFTFTLTWKHFPAWEDFPANTWLDITEVSFT